MNKLQEQKLKYEKLCELADTYDFDAHPELRKSVKSWHVERSGFNPGEPWAMVNVNSSVFNMSGGQKSMFAQMLELADTAFIRFNTECNGLTEQVVASFCVNTLLLKESGDENNE